MTIEETEKLGTQLCAAMQIDAKELKKWCDKVGNNWLDAELFHSKWIPYDDNKKYVQFGTLCGYNDVKPWIIEITVGDNLLLNTK